MRALRLLPVFLIVLPSASYAADYTITLKNHIFTPPELVIPAHEKIKVTVRNLDDSPAEFESEALNREKVIAGQSEVILYLGPLDGGIYPYLDDFHQDAKGGIVVK